MGQTLARSAQWATPKEGGKGKLEYSSLNESLLNTILKFVETPSNKTSDERKLIFKKPLVWTTQLKPSALEGPGYVFNEKHGTLTSEATVAKGEMPLLELNNDKLTIMSLEQAEYVLRVAGDKKMAELRACLEENEDVMAKMLGDRFATVEGTDNSIFRFHEEITKEVEALAKQTEKSDEKSKDVDEKKTVLRLRLKLLQLDEQMMNTSILTITRDLRLNPKIVDSEVAILQGIAGTDKKSPLEYGVQEGKPDDLDYEPADNISYQNLVALLKDRSPHFAENIMKQEFKVKHRKEKDSGFLEAKSSKDSDKEGSIDRSSRSDYFSKQQTDQHPKTDKKQKVQTKTKLEPSLKWKSLAIEEKDHEKLQLHQNKLSQVSVLSEGNQKKIRISAADADEPFSESSSESDDEEEAVDRRPEGNADLPTEYWQIQKLVKYLKGGNQTATIIALCSLRDFNLLQETCQLAIRDVGGLEVLINLLDTEEVKCK
ncbi:unnamed protein product, partial [Candidula unifasciata]